MADDSKATALTPTLGALTPTVRHALIKPILPMYSIRHIHGKITRG